MYSNENQPSGCTMAASRDSTSYANFTFVNIALTQSEEFVRGGVRLAFSRQIYQVQEFLVDPNHKTCYSNAIAGDATGQCMAQKYFDFRMTCMKNIWTSANNQAIIFLTIFFSNNQ